MSDDAPVHVQITRTVKAGSERAFEEELRAFVPRSLEFPGHMGVQVLAPTQDRPRVWHVLLRFRSPATLEQFRSWEPYQGFVKRVAPMLEAEPQVHEACGLEQWVSLPGDRIIRPVPRWKLAVATLAGVYPTSLVLAAALPRVAGDLHFLLFNMVMSAAMVILLTYAVMPVVTRILHRWLHGQPRG